MMRVAALTIGLAVGVTVTPATADTDLDGIARCLAARRVTYYWASWCAQCRRQAAMFGRALRHIRSIDCSDGCPGIEAFPTWGFADGSRLRGVTSPETLARRTDCMPAAEPSDGVDERPRGAAAEPNTRYLGGAKIIEVPRR